MVVTAVSATTRLLPIMIEVSSCSSCHLLFMKVVGLGKSTELLLLDKIAVVMGRRTGATSRIILTIKFVLL